MYGGGGTSSGMKRGSGGDDLQDFEELGVYDRDSLFFRI